MRSELDYKNKTIIELTEKLEARTIEKDKKGHNLNLLEKNIKILEDRFKLVKEQNQNLMVDKIAIIESNERNKKLYDKAQKQYEDLQKQVSINHHYPSFTINSNIVLRFRA